MSAEQQPLAPAVTIPATTVTHVLGDTSVELAQGDLQLIVQPHQTPDDPETDRAVDDVQILTLTVGKAAFPLFKKTIFGTLADDERVYVFSPQIGQPGGYVKITLPDGVKEENSELSTLQERFEQVLIDLGLLKEGLEAAADEVGRDVLERSKSVAQNIREGTTGYLADNPSTMSPMTFSDTTHSIASTASSTTRSLFDTATKVTSVVTSAAASAGAWVSSQVSPTTETNSTNRLRTLSNAYDSSTGGMSAGIGEVTSAITDSAGQIVENDYGLETRDIAGAANETVGNVGGTVGRATQIGSGAAVVVGALKGAVSEEHQEHQGEHDITEPQGERRAAKDGSGNWEDLSM